MTDVLIKQKGNWPGYEEDNMGRYRKIIYLVKRQEGLEQVHPPPSEGGCYRHLAGILTPGLGQSFH